MAEHGLRDDILLRARELGFDLVAVTGTDLAPPHDLFFAEWVGAGMHGEMSYLARRVENGIGPEDLLAGARSMIMLAVNYWRPQAGSAGAGDGRISQYAVTRDYHKVIKKKLQQLTCFIESECAGRARAFVDVGPVLERGYADAAGLGYIGRNAMLITPEFGSWVFLAVLLTDLELSASPRPIRQRCGDCVRCIDACPTGAIVADRVVDARRCISYLTIENRGPIPEELRPLMGSWIFGCDICQIVCPHNGRAETATVDAFCEVRFPNGRIPLIDILRMRTDAEFLERFAGTPIMRARRTGLVRNACVAAGNSGIAALIPALLAVAELDPDAMVREHASWAIGRLNAVHPSSR